MAGDYPTGRNGCAAFVALAVIVILTVLLLGSAVALVTERITTNQAQVAQAQVLQAQEQTAQVREHEQAQTERWQSFLIAMRATSSDGWTVVIIGAVIAELLYLAYLVLKERHHG